MKYTAVTRQRLSKNVITLSSPAKFYKNYLKFITQLFNASLILGYFPDQWKVAQIILILKPDKPPPCSYILSSISLLPILSKVFEKLL
jgi:hypothetical protein